MLHCPGWTQTHDTSASASRVAGIWGPMIGFEPKSSVGPQILVLSPRCAQDLGTCHWLTIVFKHASMSEGQGSHCLCDQIACSDHVPSLLQDGPQGLFTLCFHMHCSFLHALPPHFPHLVSSFWTQCHGLPPNHHRQCQALHSAYCCMAQAPCVTTTLHGSNCSCFHLSDLCKQALSSSLSSSSSSFLPFHKYSVSSLYMPGTSSPH